MRHAPNKIFMLENGQYIEISYDYYQRLMEENPKRRFWLFGGMLMEVSEEDYVQMNREKSRMQYQFKMAAKMGEFSYDSISTDEFDGALILEVGATGNTLEEAQNAMKYLANVIDSMK